LVLLAGKIKGLLYVVLSNFKHLWFKQAGWTTYLYVFRIEPILQTQSQPEAEAPAPIAVPRGQPRSSSEPPVPIVASSEEPTASSTSEKKSNLTELVNISSSVPSPSVSFKSVLSPFPSWQLQSPNVPPPGVQDFDRETSEDCNAVADYAPFIFCYLRSREVMYKLHIVKPSPSNYLIIIGFKTHIFSL
jgi:hypothetical protein